MIGTALFLLCATAIAHADLEDTDGFYDNGCPKDSTIEKLLPHEDCEQFYQCFRGAMISRFCPNGLHFNADLEKCDWLGNADCHNKPKEDNETASIELDKNNPNHLTLICSSAESNGVLVAHKNCNQFYKCFYGKHLVLNCAEDLLYSTALEKCDQPHNVDCGERLKAFNESVTTIATTALTTIEFSYSIEEIDQSISDASQAIAQCSAKRTDGELIPHEYCNKFYKCSGGVPITMKCPYTYMYEPNNKMCEWYKNVECDGRTLPEMKYVYPEPNHNDIEDNEIAGDEDDNTPAAICAADDSDGVLIAHEICSFFFKCSGNNPITINCPGDLLFNSQKLYCDWHSNVDCGDRIKIDTPSSKKIREDPREAHNICSTDSSDGMLVAHDSCNKFYKCHDGHPVEVKCPGILLYNLKTESCDWPTHVYCKDRIAPENGWYLKEGEENIEDTTSENSGEKHLNRRHKKVKKIQVKTRHGHRSKHHLKGKRRYPNRNADLNNAAETCANKKFEGALLPHEHCNQFYKCIEGKSMALFCPLNRFYNIQKAFCDWPHNVKCGNRIAPKNDSNGDGQSNNANEPCQGKPDGSIVSHENCSQFYKCFDGRTYSMNCPPGLYFNAVLKVCNWPITVDCGKRLTEAQIKKKPA